MPFPLDLWALLLEGEMRQWVTDGYDENRVVQFPQDQVRDITAVGFRSYSPPFLYSCESKMHNFIR